MSMVKAFAKIFGSIFVALMLMSALFPLTAAFLFWDFSFLVSDKFIKFCWIITRLWIVFTFIITSLVAFSPDVREAINEYEEAKSLVKSMKAKKAIRE